MSQRIILKRIKFLELGPNMDNLHRALNLVNIPNYQYKIEIGLKEPSLLIKAKFKIFYGATEGISYENI
jgi:hypothetical protein